MRREQDSLAKKGVYVMIDRACVPPDARVLTPKWVYKTKYDAAGNFIKHKSRLVARGFQQREGIDYDETFAGVLYYRTLRTLLAVVAHFDLELQLMDVETADLH